MNNIKRPLLYMVVALLLGELAAMMGLETVAAMIIWIIMCIMAVTVRYGLFLVGKKISGWNILWIAISMISMFAGVALFNNQSKVYEKYDRIQYGMESTDNSSETMKTGMKDIEKALYYESAGFYMEGTIVDIVDKTYTFNVELDTVDGIVYIDVENVENLVPGMRVMVSGQVESMETADNPGNYDEYSYLRSNGVVLKLKAELEDIKKKGVHINDISELNIQGLLYQFRCRIKDMLAKICTERELGLLSAMVIGEKSDIDAYVKELYSLQGIAHVFTISGLHISVIGMGIYKILRRKMWYLSSATVSTVVMICFSIMTGNSVSAVRAVVMFALHVAADVCGRKYDMLSALSLSAMFLLWDNPYYITNASFLLSYAAMIAVAVTGPIVTKFVSSRNGLINSILFNISLTFTSMPINSCLFYRLSSYSILLNLLVVPLMSIVLLMTILGIIAGFVMESAGVFMIGTAVYILRLYEELCSWTAGLPYSSVVTGGLEWWDIVLYYVCLGLMLLVMKYGWIISRLKLFKQNQKLEVFINPIRWMGITVLMFTMICTIYGPKQAHFRLCFLGVGQGDCAYIHSEAGIDYLIDGGSTDERGVGQYKIESFLEYMDVDTLEYVFVSHCDADHISGIMELIERGMIGIDNLVLPIVEKENMSENAVELVNLAQSKGIQVMYFGAGDSLTDGDMELYCASPKVGASYGDINEASMVLLIKYDELNCVFTGDIGVNTEKLILDEVNTYFATESKEELMVLKVAHHGSKGSSGKEWLDMLQPDVAVISCGEDNSYGHPHKETLERLAEDGTETMLTSKSGAIVIEFEVEVNIWTQSDRNGKESISGREEGG